MTTDDDWKSRFRPDIPSPARMYDYYLGGKDFYAADREAAERVLAAVPQIRPTAVANRAFMRRAVRYLAGECGVRQFVDIGTGLPTGGSVHETAKALDPTCRVVYVDNDPVVITHAGEMLHHVSGTTIVRHDLQDPDGILTDPRVTELIDFDEPVAVLMVAVLHFVTDIEDPYRIIGRFRDACAPGSHLVFTHIYRGDDTATEAAAAETSSVYNKATAPLVYRTQAQIDGFLDGYEPVDPGVVLIPKWRPDPDTIDGELDTIWGLAGVGRKS